MVKKNKTHKSTLRSVAWLLTVRSVAWLLYVVSLRQRDFSVMCSEKVSRYFDCTKSLCRLIVGVLVRCWEKKHKSTLRSVAWMFTVRSDAWLLYVVSLRQREFSGLCSEEVSRYFEGTESPCRLKVGVLVRCWEKNTSPLYVVSHGCLLYVVSHGYCT